MVGLVFRWSLGLCGRAIHAWQVQAEIPDQLRHGGLRHAWTVEVRCRDASAHQTCLCKRTSDGITPEEDSTSSKKAKLESQSWPDIGPTLCQGHGNRSNDIPWAWHQGQLKERAGFVILMIFLQAQKKGIVPVSFANIEKLHSVHKQPHSEQLTYKYFFYIFFAPFGILLLFIIIILFNKRYMINSLT